MEFYSIGARCVNLSLEMIPFMSLNRKLNQSKHIHITPNRIMLWYTFTSIMIMITITIISILVSVF